MAKHYEEFAPISVDLKDRIMAQTDLNSLKSWNKLAARVHSIEEFLELAEV